MAQAFGQSPLAGRLAGSYPPAEVAEQVLRSIREERFYIVLATPRSGRERGSAPTTSSSSATRSN
jgi:hypothetical protein